MAKLGGSVPHSQVHMSGLHPTRAACETCPKSDDRGPDASMVSDGREMTTPTLSAGRPDEAEPELVRRPQCISFDYDAGVGDTPASVKAKRANGARRHMSTNNMYDEEPDDRFEADRTSLQGKVSAPVPRSRFASLPPVSPGSSSSNIVYARNISVGGSCSEDTQSMTRAACVTCSKPADQATESPVVSDGGRRIRPQVVAFRVRPAAAANLAPLDLPAIDRPTQSEPVLLEMKERLTQLENEAKANEEDPPEVKAQLVQTQAELMAQIMQAEAQLKREQNARQLASQERNERLLLKHMSAPSP